MTARHPAGRSPFRSRRAVVPAAFLPAAFLAAACLAASLGCSGDDEAPSGGNVRVTVRNAPGAVAVDLGDIDTLRVTLFDATGQPVDSTVVIPAPPVVGGARTFDLTVPSAAGLSLLVRATGERPVGGAASATYVRGVLRRGVSAPFDVNVGATVPVPVTLTPFVASFHDVEFMEDGARHRVSWRPVAGAERWRVAIRRGASVRDSVLADTALAGTAVDAVYQVQAIDADSTDGAFGDLVAPAQFLPGTPVNFRLVPQSGERIDVRWNPGGGFVQRWEIERRDEGDTFRPLAGRGVDTLLFADTTVVDGRRFEYRGRARNGNGVSAWTGVVAAVAPLNAPGELTLAPNDLEFGLGWIDRSRSEEGYTLERATGNGAFIPLITLPVNAAGFVDTPLAERTRYRYRVRSFRGVLLSGYSNVVEGTTPLHLPSSPGGLAANAISPIQIDLVWGAARGIVEDYQVERRQPNGVFANLATVGGDVLVYADLGLPAGTTFEYRVRARNATGAGGWSNVAVATILAAPR
jgi:hypothetical protein